MAGNNGDARQESPDADNVEVLVPGEVVVRGGVRMRYLGNGLLEPLDMIEKCHDMRDARPIGGGREPA